MGIVGQRVPYAQSVKQSGNGLESIDLEAAANQRSSSRWPMGVWQWFGNIK